MTLVRRITRIQLICSNVARITVFYRDALGFAPGNGIPSDASAASVELRLGDQKIVLTRSRPGARPYPPDADSASLLFQHFAIVVGDMAAAYAHLSGRSGWTPISTGGPQRLPASSGGVIAFKFRDPDGHPLELLSLPAVSRSAARPVETFQGIDHSALSVADTGRSLAFYRSLGLTVAGGSINEGSAQDRLDGLSAAHVQVTPLALPTHSSPHVELLCYSRESRHTSPLAGPDDIASTRLVFAVEAAVDLRSLCARHATALVSTPEEVDGRILRVVMRDPDGHQIVLATS